MTKTKMPGFTAEAACYQGGAPYRAGSMAPLSWQRNEVIPARYYMHVDPGWRLLFCSPYDCCSYEFDTGFIDCWPDLFR